MKQWWSTLAERERFVLLIGVIILLVALGYALLWRPLDRHIALRRERVTQLSRDLQWMQVAAAKMRSLQAAGQIGTFKGPLAVAVDASARRHALEPAVIRLAPQGQGVVDMSLSAVNFNVLLRWLGDLQMQGIGIGRFDLTPVGPGRVKATLQLVRASTR